MQLKNSVDGGATRVGAKASELSPACTVTVGKSIRQQGESYVERKAKGSPVSFDSSIAGLGAIWIIASACLLAMGLFLACTTRATAATCPNESLRAENGSLSLPDCRGYERVTPPLKNGAEFNRPPVYSGPGPRLELESFATFGGAEFATLLGSVYEFLRSPSGWVTQAAGAPATQFEGTDSITPLVALGSGGASLLGLRPRGALADAEILYLKRGGSVAEIGPEAPPSSWHGLPNQESTTINENSSYFSFQVATPDLSHVVYELFSPSYLWSFDQTGEFMSSTYEYAGTGNTQPFLVGVTGGLGSTSLVSGCGTSVGSLFSGEAYNAISSDGSTVFFTPWSEETVGSPSCGSPVPPTERTELYARVNGEKPSARTVSVSEPSVADCSVCETEPAARRPATFQGASEDGSKAFFLTEQELLPDNPGMNLYEYNFNGPPGQRVTAVSHLASNGEAGVLGVVRVSQDGSRVYFVASAELTSTPNSTGAHAEAGEPNMYAYDTRSGGIKFVATLSPQDSGIWSATDVGRPAQATPNGRFLLFTSTAQITPDDTSTVSQLFRYDNDTGQLIRVSAGQNGFNDNGNTDADPIAMGQVNNLGNSAAIFERNGFGQTGPHTKMMSDDGSYVFFESSKGLTPKAADHVEVGPGRGQFAENVYEWHDGQVSLISDGRDLSAIGLEPSEFVNEARSSVHLVGTDATGENFFFTTASPLVPSDTDESQDIYDARIGGGFVEPASFPCQGETCQGLPSVGLAPPTVGSANFVGPENEKPRKKHVRHRKRHHKSKPPRHHKKHRGKSRAKPDGRRSGKRAGR